MPMLSNSDLAEIQDEIRSSRSSVRRLREKFASPAARSAQLITAGVAAGAVGFARGKFEDKTNGQWNLPGTTVDVELLTVAGLAALAVGGDASSAIKPYVPLLADAASGVLGHYVGQIGRKYAQTGKFTLIAGGLPPYDPTSYNPTQMAAPYDDPSAAALASSGI